MLAALVVSRHATFYSYLKKNVHSALTGAIVEMNDCAAEGGLHAINRLLATAAVLQLTLPLELERLHRIDAPCVLHTSSVLGVSSTFRTTSTESMSSTRGLNTTNTESMSSTAVSYTHLTLPTIYSV